MRNAIDFTSITLRSTLSSSRQSVFSTTSDGSQRSPNGHESQSSVYLVKTWRIKKVIWDQLLATKAEIIQSIFSFRVKRDKVNIFSGKISLLHCFPLGVIRSPQRLFFCLNHLRIVWKRCSHSTSRSWASRCSKSLSSGFVPQQQIRCSMNTMNSNKRIQIFSTEIFTVQVAYFVEILLIQLQVVTSNHFGSRIKRSYLHIYGNLFAEN